MKTVHTHTVKLNSSMQASKICFLFSTYEIDPPKPVVSSLPAQESPFYANLVFQVMLSNRERRKLLWIRQEGFGTKVMTTVRVV